MKLNPQESQYVSSYAKEAAVHGLPEQLLLRSQLFPGDYAFGAQSAEEQTGQSQCIDIISCKMKTTHLFRILNARKARTQNKSLS